MPQIEPPPDMKYKYRNTKLQKLGMVIFAPSTKLSDINTRVENGYIKNVTDEMRINIQENQS